MAVVFTFPRYTRTTVEIARAGPEPAQGPGGMKVAYLDEIRFLAVKAPTVRADGV